MLDLFPNDNKLINLMTVFGNPFPKLRNSPTGTQTTAITISDEGYCDMTAQDKSVQSASLENGSDRNKQSVYSEGGNEEDVCVEVMEEESYENSIQVFIELHEGKETTNSSFSIYPEQMVCLQ